jgi:multiple sugar transport system permease protein
VNTTNSFQISKKISKTALSRNLWGYFFLAPRLIIFSVFLIYPIIRGLLLSFMEYKVKGSRWVGLDNFIAIMKDDLFITALKNTTYYTIGVVPAGILLALFFSAIIFPLAPRMQTFFKSAFYLPGVISGVVVALTWSWIMDPDTGLLNYILSLVNLGPYQWLSHAKTSMFSLILINLLSGQGVSIIIILANMAAIPLSLYESAKIDGANEWRLFRHITVPLLKPTILYLVIMGIISSYQVFESIYVLTRGGPMNSTTTIAYLIFQEGLGSFEFGRASAIATVLLVIIFILSILQFRIFKEEK